jgi:hypothetical protein
MTASQIEIVLPLKPHSETRGSDLLRATDGLIASFNRFADPGFIARFAIVAPEADLPALVPLGAASRIALTLLAEETLFPPPPKMPRHGSRLQQMIKIAYAGVCRTEFYLTLDADTVLADPLDARVLSSGRAPYHPEPLAAHALWWEAAAIAMHTPVSASDTPDRPVFGATPAFVSTAIMRRLIRRLTLLAEAREQDWPDYLAAHITPGDRNWTEYALYWTELINHTDPGTIHVPATLYALCQTTAEATARIRFGTDEADPLFAVLQSSSIDAATHAAFCRAVLAPPAH